jgi:diguanylate cyclase (GGDEF)-like protein/PAS domain S-box-containing protein
LLLDAGGMIRWCSDAARQLLARPLQGVLGRPIAEFIPQLALHEDTPGYNAAYVAFSFGEDRFCACRMLETSDDAFDADVAVSPVRLGETRGFLVALHRSCDPLLGRIDMQRFVESLATDEDPVLIVDEHGRVTHANAAFEALTGFIQVEVIGAHADTLTGEVGTGRFTQRSAWLQQGRHVRSTSTCLRRDGTRMHVDESMRPFVDALGRITHYVLRLRDASDRVEQAERVAWLAHHDMLTELPNRALFADRLQREIARATRRGGGFALLCLDLDGFKLINDRFGHAAGDEMLRLLAQRLRAAVREEDTIARLGGDEFALILPGVATRVDLEAVCRSVGPRLSGGLLLEGANVALSLSAGVACFPHDARDGDALVRAADRAMYSAKRAGGNRVHFADDVDSVAADTGL